MQETHLSRGGYCSKTIFIKKRADFAFDQAIKYDTSAMDQHTVS
jgi:hypothetical protein